jgi:glycosyltransferase involved in cell wall biosynthesis
MLPQLFGKIDLVHGWPLASLLTIRAAGKLGIPVVLERPNAHTRHAFEVVAKECRDLGFKMPAGHDHEFNARTLEWEEAEYAEADALLCPSDFVARTFSERGFPEEKLLRHHYGYDDRRFHPGLHNANAVPAGLTILYAGTCDPRKGLHHALRAWRASGASECGRFLIAGVFAAGYRECLGDLLYHPAIEVLGQRSDLNVLMRECDVLILPTVEEGSALVTYEAMASGCVPVVSDSSGAPCRHLVNGLVHKTGDLAELTSHLRLLDGDRAILVRLRENAIKESRELTWSAAGRSLASVYQRFGGVSEVRDRLPSLASLQS